MQLSHAPSETMVEFLEPRALLSVSPVSITHVEPIRAATQVKRTIPALAGTTYAGPLSTTTGIQYNLAIVFLTQSKAGALRGTFTVTATGQYGSYNVTGTVNLTHKVSIHSRSKSGSLVITGTLSADSSTFSGKFTSTSTVNHKSLHGSYSTSRVTSAPG